MSAPTVSAGNAQIVPNNQPLVLTGTVSPGSSPLVKWGWSQISGPDCIIIGTNSGPADLESSSSNAIVIVYELSPGTYVFQFSAQDELANVSTSNVTIIVTSVDVPLFIPLTPHDEEFV
jgi:hypothetical protein